MSQKKQSILAVLSLLLLVMLDQASKLLAVYKLSPEQGGTDQILWQGVFRLHYLENRGAAFGMMQGRKLLLAATALIVAALLCLLYVRLPKEPRFSALRWLIVFLLAGALGNFIDRMRLGYVIDFFYFELINFPVFNVADIYVTCSVLVFLALFLFYYKEEDLNRIWPRKVKREG